MVASNPTSARSPGPIPEKVSQFACIDFVNSAFHDHLGSGQIFDRIGLMEWWQWFADRWNLGEPPPLAPAFLRDMKELRATLRKLLEGGKLPGPLGIAEFNEILRRSPYILAIKRGGDRVRLVISPVRPGRSSIAAAIVHSFGILMEAGDLTRLKVCANPDCSFLFYDESHNVSRRWCDATICGNLMKVRAHRASGANHRQ